jgi:hypothetical protein
MSDPILDAFHAAAESPGDDSTGKPNYLDAILGVIDAHAPTLLVGESAARFRALPDNEDRQQAIATGLREIRTLFGDFTSVEFLTGNLNRQIEVEYAKHLFINAVDAAATHEEMVAAISAHVTILNQHRQELIDEWAQMIGNPAAVARSAELQIDPYTLTLNAIVGRLDDSNYIADLASRLLADRDARENDRFDDISAIIASMKAAADAFDTELLTAFNTADTWSTILAAIRENASSLLDPVNAAKMAELPDNGDREEAIGRDLKKIQELLGPFATVAELKEAVSNQIETEHAKHLFVSTIDSAGNLQEMMVALWTYTGLLDQHRQFQIAGWGEHSSEPAVAAYIAELQNDPYTLLLRETASRMNDEEFLTDLAGKLLAARDGTPGGQFLRLAEVISALEDAIDILNDLPTAPSVQNLATNEDSDLVDVPVGASDPDGDTLTYDFKAGASPQKGTVTFTDGAFAYSPHENAFGKDTFTIIVSDGEGGVIEQVVNITINEVNDAPVAGKAGTRLRGMRIRS